MRLDKFLGFTGGITRSEAKQYLKKGLITVNGETCKSGDSKIDENKDTVTLSGRTLTYAKNRYYLLHKPAGVITATEDKNQETVLDLLEGMDKRNLFPVGRLDKDTEGLLLITDNGELAHRLLAPKKHVDKQYFVKIKKPLSAEDKKYLTEGVDIGDEELTLPAEVEILNAEEILLTIREGRFHQVKRMLEAVGNEVLYLKRLSMGPLVLPPDLEKGAFRPLTEEETEKLKQENYL